MTEKVDLGSQAWLEHARAILEELVQRHGVEGVNFSLVEELYDAPPGLIGPRSDVVSWNLVVEGRRARVAEGELPAPDVRIRGAYRTMLEGARTVICEDQLPKGPVHTAQQQVEGSPSKMPRYLAELHNRLAAITA